MQKKSKKPKKVKKRRNINMFEIVSDKKFEANLKSMISYNIGVQNGGLRGKKKWKGDVIYP